MHRPLLVLGSLLLAAGTTWGQSPPAASDQAEQVRMLLERVQQLEKRVNELEAKQVASATPPPAAPNVPTVQQPAPAPQAAASPVPGHQHDVQETTATVQQMETHYPSLQIRGFGDVDFSATDQHGTNSGFNLGQLDLHLASPLSKKVSYFGEIT